MKCHILSGFRLLRKELTKTVEDDATHAPKPRRQEPHPELKQNTCNNDGPIPVMYIHNEYTSCMCIIVHIRFYSKLAGILQPRTKVKLGN